MKISPLVYESPGSKLATKTSGAPVPPALTAATLGSFPTALQLLTMAGWAAAFGLAAARFFRWE